MDGPGRAVDTGNNMVLSIGHATFNMDGPGRAVDTYLQLIPSGATADLQHGRPR